MSLLKALRRFLGKPDEPGFAPIDPRVAAAALLVHAVGIDGAVAERERRVLFDVLRRRFSLDESEVRALVAEARARDAEAVDLHGFTGRLKRALDREGRLDVIEMLWDVVEADGAVHEFEDDLVWRVAELLDVSSDERLASRRARRGFGPEP